MWVFKRLQVLLKVFERFCDKSFKSSAKVLRSFLYSNCSSKDPQKTVREVPQQVFTGSFKRFFETSVGPPQ
jgi:hypothetical protein